MKSNKVLLIYNPWSGNGLFKNNLDKIIEMFQRKKMIVVPIRADKPTFMAEVFKEAEKSDFRKVIAAGGVTEPIYREYVAGQHYPTNG